MPSLKVAEYFAGIGLARSGLERAGFDVVWSNDVSVRKHEMFHSEFVGRSSGHTFQLGDLQDVTAADIPEGVDVAWASFPCTDLSLAGTRAGLHRGASSAFWLFIRNLAALKERRPHVVALENVTGFVSSRAGRDLEGAIEALNGLGYSVDVLNLDARRFVPQSRPRMFLIGVRGKPIDDSTPSELRPGWLDRIFNDSHLRTHRATLPAAPPLLVGGLTDIVERLPAEDPRWWNEESTVAFVESLSEIQAARVDLLRKSDRIIARSAFRRMRGGVPRWEVRDDDIAGCLRTARGGSSRQALVVAGDGELKVRWMTPVEYARLMGAPNYNLASATTYQAYSGFGDAVCVPVVEWLARHHIAAQFLPSPADQEGVTRPQLAVAKT